MDCGTTYLCSGIILHFTIIRKGHPLSLRNKDISSQFDELVREHERALYRVAWRLCGNRDEALDLMQDTLIEAFESFSRFTPGTHFDRWIFRIMKNTFIDIKRKKSKTTIESLDTGKLGDDGESSPIELVDMSGGADARLMANTLDGPIQNALMDLPEEFRIVVILSDIEEYSYEEVSSILGCPIGTVRSRLHRGRAILKEKLKDYVRF